MRRFKINAVINERTPAECTIDDGRVINEDDISNHLPHKIPELEAATAQKCHCTASLLSDGSQKIDLVQKPDPEPVDHPDHYGGEDNPYEAIKVIEAWGLSFSTGNAVKYISRAGKKDPRKTIEDLMKARWYLDREIANLEKSK